MGSSVEPGKNALALVLYEHDRFALLWSEELDKLGGHSLELLAELLNELGALVPASGVSGGKSGMSCINSLVEGLASGNGDLSEDLLGSRIQDVRHLGSLGVNELAVDHVREETIKEFGSDAVSHVGRFGWVDVV